MKRGFCAYFLVVASILTACSKNVTTPTPVPPGPAQLTRLSVTGNSSLTAIGQTSQLTATATFSDGVVKDVSRDTNWVSNDPSVMVVSSTGLVTAVRFGTSIIYAHYQYAQYQTQSGNLSVTATLPGTFAMTGSVKEPGQGPVAQLRVIDTVSAMSTQTESSGRYYLALLSASPTHLRFEKDGYEPAELDATPGAATVDVRVQQIIRLVAGETVTPPRLAPGDLTYLVGAGERCNSCRLIRVVVPVKGTLHLRLTWTEQCVVTLGLWVGGQHVVPSGTSSTEVDADVAAGAGEMIFYVDRYFQGSPPWPVCPVPFVLATSLTE
jgi:hypothetical protein